MFKKSLGDIVIFDPIQLPDGFSIYKGVLVNWDEDHDMRVISFLDLLPQDVLERLAMIHESEGCVGFLWKEGPIPEEYREGAEQIEFGWDLWTISSSVAPE